APATGCRGRRGGGDTGLPRAVAMRGRPWPGALGLRGRIVGVVLVTAVATLAVAAVALLGPLQSRLRNAELSTLERQVTAGSTQPFKRHDLPAAFNQKPALTALEHDVGGPIGASEVALLGYPEPSGRARPILVWPDADSGQGDSYDDTAAAYHTHKPTYTFASINGVQSVRAAIPFTTPSDVSQQPWHWFLVVRKPLGEVSSAVAAVRTAFLVAALVALGLTLILGIPLSATIVRRLRRLRQAALQLAEGGPPVEVPVDRARDEVGDLARRFALMQQRHERQEEARRAFVATASHELRTPLATLDGMLELLGEDLRSGNPDLDDAHSLLERARAQSKRLGRLAADLLDLSRIDARVELRSEPVELGELSRAVLAEFDLGTAERGIVTVLDDSSGSVWALGDPGSVARILRILLDNAIRLSP